MTVASFKASNYYEVYSEFLRKGSVMRVFAIIMLVSAALWNTHTAAQAQQANACKECRDFHRACVKAHSQAACKTDYDICMKHCRK